MGCDAPYPRPTRHHQSVNANRVLCWRAVKNRCCAGQAVDTQHPVCSVGRGLMCARRSGAQQRANLCAPCERGVRTDCGGIPNCVNVACSLLQGAQVHTIRGISPLIVEARNAPSTLYCPRFPVDIVPWGKRARSGALPQDRADPVESEGQFLWRQRPQSRRGLSHAEASVTLGRTL